MSNLPSRKSFFFTLAGLIVAALLFSWQVMPRILQAQAEKYIAGAGAHHLTMNRPEFNPFEWRLRLSGLHLTGPDGKPLLSFNELVIDLSSASLYRRALVFDDIRLEGLKVQASLLADGKLNWSALISALQDPKKTQTPDTALPRFLIHHFALSGTVLNFADQRIKPAFITQIKPLDLTLTELSSLPGNKGQYTISALSSFGAQLAWQGVASLNPLAASGSFKLDNLNVANFAPYLNLPEGVSVKGIAGLSAHYRLDYAQGKPAIKLAQIAAKLAGVQLKPATGPAVTVDAIEAVDGRFDLASQIAQLGKLKVIKLALQTEPAPQVVGTGSVEDVHVNLNKHQATVGRIALDEGQLHIARDAQGHIDILQALPRTTNKPEKPQTVPWHYQLAKLQLQNFDVVLKDQAAQLGLKNIAVEINNISDDLNIALPLTASFTSADGGSFTAEGQVIPAKPAVDLQIRLADLSLLPAQPLLSRLAKLKLVKGQLSAAGHASYGAQGAKFSGNFALSDLRLVEADTGNLFLGLKSLSSRAFDVTPSELDINELVINGLDATLIINKDKSLSFNKLLLPVASTGQQTIKSAPFGVNIDRLRLVASQMEYADYSLALPFGTRIHDLKGIINGLSTRSDAQGQLTLDGLVDEYGTAHAAGQLNLSNPADMTDIKVIFKNIEMARLTPYSATFAGRRITSGKLSLDLEYKLKQRQLAGDNQVVMNQLTLGERVSSPEAKDLPLDLAIAILQDSDGKIELGLPVSGSLDDPRFSYRSIIWKAFSNVLGKIVTAPFRALGALFGSDKAVENIVFESGNAQLSPPEREKLQHLAQMLVKRPRLSIAIHGVYAETDRVAIADLQLRRSLAQGINQHLEAGEDPGPLASHDPKVQHVLEKLFAARFDDGELAALKQGFRQANPGQLTESTIGKVLSGLTLHKKRTLTEQEVSQLKGIDFYTLLFERLRSKVVVAESPLQELAGARAADTESTLKNAGVPADRLTILPAEKVDAQGTDVPVKLMLGNK